MKSEFDRAFPVVLVHEGGYVNHPKDPGGATMKGVTQRVYDGYRDRLGVSRQPVRQITNAELHTIYRKQYWDAIRGDEMPAGVGYVVYDGAVNSGPSQSIKWLQRALGVRADGAIGSVTLAALEAHGDPDLLISSICDQRMKFLRALDTFNTFGRGWTRRVADVRKRGQAWASGSIGPAVIPIKDGEGKAVIEDAKPRPTTTSADTATVGGVAAGGVLAETRDALEPVSYSSGWAANIVVVLSLVIAAVTIGGLVWRWWSNRKAKEHDEALGLVEAAV